MSNNTTASQYELMVILSPDLRDSEQKDLLKKIREEIKEQNGKIANEDIWGLRDLAYKIKHHEKGFYAIFYFNLPGEKLRDFSEFLRLETGILRNVVLTLPKDYVIRDFQKEEAEAREAAQIEAEAEKKKPFKRAIVKIAKREIVAIPETKEKKAEPEKTTIEKDTETKEEAKTPSVEKQTEQTEQTEPEEKTEKIEKTTPAKKKTEAKKKLSAEEIDKKLDDILNAL